MYSERPRKDLWLTLILLIALAAAGFATWTAVTTPKTPTSVLPLVFGVFALALYFVVALYLMEYRVTSTHVEIVYPPFTYRFDRRSIRSVHVHSTPWWMGVGIKILGRRIAFTTRFGNVVDLEKTSGFFRNVWLTPDEPDAFAARLKK